MASTSTIDSDQQLVGKGLPRAGGATFPFAQAGLGPLAPNPSQYNMFGLKRKAKISKREIVHMTTQLAIMSRAGVDIVTSFESLIKQTKNSDALSVFSKIHTDLISGRPFSAALAEHQKVFGNSYVASVTAGEASGKMWHVLSRLAKLQRNELRLVRSIQTMAMYPTVLVMVSLSVIAALMFFVLPQFAKIFNDFETPLPLVTQVLIGMANEFTHRFWLWIPLMVMGCLGAIQGSKTIPGRKFWNYIALNVFPIREISRSLLIGRMCRMLGMLLESGVPLLESLGLVRSSITNVYYKDLLAKLEQSVLNGNGFGRILSESEFVPDAASEMILTAEKTGSLSDATHLIGEHFEEEGEEKLRGLVAVLEPAITVVMGAVVAFVVLAVALPMFDLANVVQQ